MAEGEVAAAHQPDAGAYGVIFKAGIELASASTPDDPPRLPVSRQEQFDGLYPPGPHHFSVGRRDNAVGKLDLSLA